LTAEDRAVLDLIGRHPFLTAPQLAAVLGKPIRWVHARRRRLENLAFVRRVPAAEVAPAAADLARHTVLELTTAGLQLVAAQQGLTLAQAVRHNGLAGGGPAQPIGQRRGLLATLRHTVGANGVVAGLYETARRRAGAGHDDAVLEWRGAAACASGRLRPDGYGVYRCDGVPYGFFLEYDRGTMRSRDYRKKFAAYYAFLDGERYRREYDACPTLLIVTTDGAAAARISRAALALGVGRATALRLLLTRESRLHRHPTTAPPSEGMLGPIWETPGEAGGGRPPWPVRR
jgi:hypothetical protein